MPNKIFLRRDAAIRPIHRQVKKMGDTSRYTRELGFHTVLTGNTPIGLAYALGRVTDAEVILAIHPYIFPPEHRTIFRSLSNSLEIPLFKDHLKKSGTSLILWVTDLRAMQRFAKFGFLDERLLNREKEILELADAIITCPGLHDWIRQIYRLKNVELYGCDANVVNYQVEVTSPSISDISEIKIAYIPRSLRGLRKNAFLQKLPTRKLRYDFFGKDGNWIHEKGINYLGFKPLEEILEHIARRCHFGLLYYTDEALRYIKNSYTHKASMYLSAGLPLLAQKKQNYIANFIREHKVGLIYDNISDIEDEISFTLKDDNYIKFKKNAIAIGKKVNNGYFLKKPLKDALRKFGYVY